VTQLDAPPPAVEDEVIPAAPSPRKRRLRPSRHNLVRDVIEVLALALALYIIITFALQTVRVDGTSMTPTLQNGDLLFADKLSYHLHSPSRGDIIILEPSSNPDQDFIKRIIGVPGDVIEIKPDYSKNGSKPRAAVLVKPGGQGDFQVLDEPYLPDQTQDPWVDTASCCTPDGHWSPEPNPITIPQDQYFFLGDNRNASKDSRAIGFTPRNKILGRAWLRIWPLNHLGFMGSGPTLVAALALPLPLGRFGWKRRRRRGLWFSRRAARAPTHSRPTPS
jgi:signal peptidase I